MSISSQSRHPAAGRAGPMASVGRGSPGSEGRTRSSCTYHGILIASQELIAIADTLCAVPGEMELRADGYRFQSAEELVDFALEEMAVSSLEVAVRSGGDEVRFQYLGDRVILSIDARTPVFRSAFRSGAAVLDACRPTGTSVCDIAAAEDVAGERPWLEALSEVVHRVDAQP
jgi:hypothetical protein